MTSLFFRFNLLYQRGSARPSRLVKTSSSSPLERPSRPRKGHRNMVFAFIRRTVVELLDILHTITLSFSSCTHRRCVTAQHRPGSASSSCDALSRIGHWNSTQCVQKVDG